MEAKVLITKVPARIALYKILVDKVTKVQVKALDEKMFVMLAEVKVKTL